MHATREDVTNWVNPSAWDDPEEADRVIEAIIESGSDDEADWVRIAGGDDADIEEASDRDENRAESLILEELAAYRAAEAAYEQARDDLHNAMRAARRKGASAYRLAKVTGLSERHVGRITNDTERQK